MEINLSPLPDDHLSTVIRNIHLFNKVKASVFRGVNGTMMRSLFAGFILSGGKGVTTGHVKLCGFEPKIVNQEDGTVV